MMQYKGFPLSGIGFLRELADNNNRQWFSAHRTAYEELVHNPALELVTTLGEELAAAFPPVTYSTAGNGGSLMRLYRDTRFSADKTPYKTNVAMMFVPENRPKMGAPGFGIQITTENVELIAGQFAFDALQLERYRKAVLDEGKGTTLLDAVSRVTKAGNYTIGGRVLKRVPQGYDKDHSRAEWLKYKGLHVFAPAISLEVAATPALISVVMEHFKAMSPIWSWLIEYVDH
jgi:uncharacterized protein (TIGR02453 family)